MKNTALAALLVSAAAAPVLAGDPFVVPVTAEVLSGWVQPDGTRMAALHLQLEPGWKTYWRAPGDAGIPPSFDWTGSSNMETVSITWPAPKVFDQNGLRSIGYENDLVIPLTIAPGDAGRPVHLTLQMDIGVCSDICVPHSVSFDYLLDTAATKPMPQIAAALAQRPYTAREAGVTAATCAVEPTADGLRIEARVTLPSTGGTEVMVIEPGLGEVWVSEAETRREGAQLIATSEMIHVGGETIALDRSAVRMTVLGGSHAVDIQGCTAG